MGRQYTPRVGDKIKLKDIERYNKYSIGLWSWLKVMKLSPTKIAAVIHIMNGLESTGEKRIISLRDIQPPLGWKPVYTIHLHKIEDAVKFVNEWFKKGITVWISHDLSKAGTMAYTPNGEEPNHWMFTKNPVETISPQDCKKQFIVKLVARWEPELPPTSKKYQRRKAIKRLRDDGISVSFEPDGFGGRVATCRRVDDFYTPPE